MKEYKLHNTDGKTFFDFRSNPESRCEGFTLTFCDDGTVVVSGDYGTLCWKRNYNHEGTKDFQRDYGFPNKETGIGYFAEKVCLFGVKQEIKEWNKDKAIVMFKERYKDDEEKDEYKEILENIEFLEDYDEIKFYELIQDLDCDCHEYNWKVYTSQFKHIFECLKSVSDQIWEAVKNDANRELSISKGCGRLFDSVKGLYCGGHNKIMKGKLCPECRKVENSEVKEKKT